MSRLHIGLGSAALLCLCAGGGGAQVYTATPDAERVQTQQVRKGPGAERQEPDRRTAARVTLTVNDSSLLYVVTEIARQAKLKVVYRDAADVLARRVNVKLVDRPVMEAFAEVLAGTGLIPTLAPTGNTVGIRARDTTAEVGKKISRAAGEETGVLAGVVMDSATGKPVAGVTVTVIGNGRSTITAEDGRFMVPGLTAGNHSVQFKLLGYTSVSQSVSVREKEQVRLRVAMVPSVSTLSEVVTTVTGSQRKIEVGNDITTLNVPEIMKQAPITSVTDLLETRVPGLTVMRTSGVPGAPSRIRLRGLGGGLLSGQEGAPTNDPIVVVDGIRIQASQSGTGDQSLGKFSSTTGVLGYNFPVPSALDQIDPNSIEKIEVLKGPSASALYGSDAASGVIVITTKRGRAGPTRWSTTVAASLEAMSGFYASPGYYPRCVNISGGVISDICSFGLSGMNTSFVDSVVRFQALNSSRLRPFGAGNGTELSTSVSGGTPTVTYSLTGSMSNTIGLFKVPTFYQDLFRTRFDSAMPAWMRRPNQYQDKAASASVTLEPYRNLRVSITSRLTSSTQRQSGAQMQLSNLAGQYIDTAVIESAVAALEPYATRMTSNRWVADNTVVANWDAWRIIPLTATVGFSRDTRDDTQLLANGVVKSTDYSLGFYSTGTQLTNTESARFNGTLMPGRRVSTAFGTDLTTQSRRQAQLQADSLLPGASTPQRIDQAQSGSFGTSTGGWFLEPRLNLNSRFFVNPGFRLDGNSASGSRSGVNGGVWSLFPKLNFSWIALDARDDRPYGGVLSLLRPRLSLGVAGVQPAPGWHLRLMSESATRGVGNNDEGVVLKDGGLALSTLGNTRLQPERTREIEGGFDADLWGGRVSITVTQFLKVRNDAIEQLSVAPSVYGGMPQYTNIGRVRNIGTELSLAATILETEFVRWGVNLSVSQYSNKLVSLNSEQSYIVLDGGTRLVEGYPLFGRWERPILGYRMPLSSDGRLSYNDLIIGDDYMYMGQSMPNFELPVSTSLSLFRGQLSVNATFQYKDGLTQFNSGSQQTLRNLYLNPNATLAEQAAALAADRCTGSNLDSYCTLYGLIQTVSVLRFNTLSIGYNIPRAMTQRFGVPSVSVAIQGSNLALWSNYRGKDPDVNGRTLGDATEDSGQLPRPRQWRLQVRMGN